MKITEKWNGLRRRLAWKLLCGLMFALACILALGSFAGCAFLSYNGLLDKNPNTDFFESRSCANLVSRNFWQNLQGILTYDPAQSQKNIDAFDWTDSNILFSATYYRLDPETGSATGSPLGTVQTPSGERAAGQFPTYMTFWADPASSASDQREAEIQIYVRSPLLDNGDGLTAAQGMFDWAAAHTGGILAGAALYSLAALLFFILLLNAAGHRRKGEGISLNWFDKIPFDLLAALVAVADGFVLAGAANTFRYTFSDGSFPSLWYFTNTAAAVLLTLTALGLSLALCMSFAARVKTGAWWRNTLIYRWVYRGARALFRAVPIVWRSALVFCIIAFFYALLAAVAGVRGGGFSLFLLVLFSLALLCAVILIAVQLRALKKGGEALAAGKLDYKIDTGPKWMLWEFRQHGENLNRISDGLYAAVEERLKSERLKTELITNVSHDIKTPLTSIINYVDLLKKEGPGGEHAAAYLDVLDRQSARLKKLTEDLVEASKASAGALPVEKSETDIGELLSQAVGEYSERLSAARIEPVISGLDQGARVMADGKLLWRVFDNLLSNICKYALPGTRAYFSIEEDSLSVRVTVRNISAAALNISADELMERFVRGDSSRSTEGSGLGLAISQSLMRLQGGTFQILLDGDLFKVVVGLVK